ncbi:hypothetical protein AAT19DRAFT_13754 [Rhodotorula toruloides]|uniref:Uncharacterized protein n=1 Tax=Rhodotorula toruloides TaxID=5286 RepID=A0A2T0ACE6_RHOTO|nr:hypothetical protein AAT19DRAFT_13754 [Rhodotorula toruloides]
MWRKERISCRCSLPRATFGFVELPTDSFCLAQKLSPPPSSRNIQHGVLTPSGLALPRHAPQDSSIRSTRRPAARLDSALQSRRRTALVVTSCDVVEALPDRPSALARHFARSAFLASPALIKCPSSYFRHLRNLRRPLALLLSPSSSFRTSFLASIAGAHNERIVTFSSNSGASILSCRSSLLLTTSFLQTPALLHHLAPSPNLATRLERSRPLGALHNPQSLKDSTGSHAPRRRSRCPVPPPLAFPSSTHPRRANVRERTHAVPRHLAAGEDARCVPLSPAAAPFLARPVHGVVA